jgi:hypothetical protein
MVGKLLKLYSYLFFVLPLKAYAAGSTIESACPASGTYTRGLLKGLPCSDVPGADNPADAVDYIRVLFFNVSVMILSVLGTLFIIMVIIGGILYISSAGNEDRAKSGKKTLTAAIVGLLITILAYAIVKIFATLIGGGVG